MTTMTITAEAKQKISNKSREVKTKIEKILKLFGFP